MNQQNNRNGKLLWLLPAAVLAVVAAVLLTREPEAPPATEPMPTVTIRDSAELSLGQGLVIERLDGYSGVYMEDGSDDIVQDVMMLLLRNDSDRCLQLARIDVTCGGETVGFEVTDLPAGSRAVLLERSRRVYNGESVQLAQVRGIPFSGSSGVGKNEQMPLAAVVYLSQAPRTTIAPLTGFRAFRKLWEGCSVNLWDRADVDTCAENVTRVLERVPMYHLACTPDESAVRALEQRLEEA